ncbi:MAG TPA: hypothetical protein VNO52_03300 [Methylomirabilota bacterium]|nr:hypothetical protein [Methylomirabilota bacterium]
MSNSTSHVWLHGRALAATTFLAALVAAASVAAQSDDFNDGNDQGWTRYDTIGSVAGPQGTFSFPGGNTYRIQAARSPNPAQLGPGRIGSLRATPTYTDFYLAVDLVDWDDTKDQAFGLLARIGNVGLGQTTGYAFTYQNQDGDFSISVINGEDADDLPGSSRDLVLDPSKDYRLVFVGRGDQFEGRVYELPNVTTPIAVTSGTDSTHASGICGLIVYDNASAANQIGADATFDNYVGLAEEPAVLSVSTSFGEVFVSWPRRFEGYTLQTSSDPRPTANWLDIDPFLIQMTDTDFIHSTTTEGNAAMFFRLKK